MPHTYTDDQLDTFRREIGDKRKAAFPDTADLTRVLNECDGDFDAAVGRALWLMMTDAGVFDNYASGYSATDQAAMRSSIESNYKVWERRFGNKTSETQALGRLVSGPITYSTPRKAV